LPTRSPPKAANARRTGWGWRMACPGRPGLPMMADADPLSRVRLIKSKQAPAILDQGADGGGGSQVCKRQVGEAGFRRESDSIHITP
jgi:hypothetical protein